MGAYGAVQVKLEPYSVEWVRSAKRDASKFEELVREHTSLVRWKLSGLCDPHELDDLTQDVWVKVWLGLERYKGTGRFTSWLWSIAVNVGLEHLRAKGCRIPSGAEPTQERGVTCNCQRVVLAKELLRVLHHEDAVLLVQREVWGLSVGEIAESLGLTPGGARKRLWLARQRSVERLRHLSAPRGV